MTFYDRIISAHAMLCSRKFEVPSSVRTLAANTLKQMKYHVQTAKRVSNDLYASTNDKVLYGSRQGSGNAGKTGYS